MSPNTEQMSVEFNQARVLVVEDSALDAELVLRELSRGGFELTSTVVETPEAFVRAVRSNCPDVVLADYNLHGWRGMDALDILRREGLDVPLILVSGALGEETAVECLKQGATDYVLKDRLVRLPLAVRRALREKHLREAQRCSEELFRRAVDALPTGILMVDGRGKILLANREAEKQFGYRPDEIVGQTVELLVPGRLRGRHEEERTAYHHSPSVRSMAHRQELYGQRKDGSEFPVEVALNPVHTSRGQETLVAMVDITERKQAERAKEEFTRELRRSNAELERSGRRLVKS